VILSVMSLSQRVPMSREMQEQLHSRAQDMMRSNVVTAAATQKNQQHHEALLARLDMDAALLLGMMVISSCTVGRTLHAVIS